MGLGARLHEHLALEMRTTNPQFSMSAMYVVLHLRYHH